MSLGGYKFAGYKCNRGSLSDTEFCLLMHKTRLKAFVEACSKTESDWGFCKNSGTINFESNTGVIYDVNSNGYNYVSFLQYKNENKYLAILTLPNQTSGYFNDAAKIYDYSTISYPCNMYYFTCFHCASLDPFDDYQFFLNSHTYPTKALQLLPITNLYTHSDSVANLDTQWSFYADATRGYTCYFGYAVKGSKILSFASTSDMDYLTYGYINATILGFDAMKLSSSSDTCNIFAACLRDERTGEIGWSHVTVNNNGPNKHIITLTGTGNRFNGKNKSSNCMTLNNSHIAITDGTSNTIPFCAETVISGDRNYNQISSGLNSDGILSKGIIDIDFLASNIRPGDSLLDCEKVSNGNYLLVSRGTTNEYSPQYYVGWDHSNPDIKLDSSWSEYTL
jgi:hypothetical protein